jgi:hypothetical protein
VRPLEQCLKLTRIAAAVYEEAVGIVAIGQLHGKRFDLRPGVALILDKSSKI